MIDYYRAVLIEYCEGDQIEGAECFIGHVPSKVIVATIATASCPSASNFYIDFIITVSTFRSFRNSTEILPDDESINTQRTRRTMNNVLCEDQTKDQCPLSSASVNLNLLCLRRKASL